MSTQPPRTPKRRAVKPSRWAEAVYVAACAAAILTASSLVIGSLMHPGQGVWVVSAKGGSALGLFRLALKHLQQWVHRP